MRLFLQPLFLQPMKRLAGLLALAAFAAACAALPPTTTAPAESPSVRQIDVHGRQADVWTWPGVTGAPKAGTILFSHGAASAPWKYERLISVWTEAGYTVHAPLHVDSEDHPDREAHQGLASWKARMDDMHRLAETLDLETYVAAGHSYGALVALTLGGATPQPPPDWTGELSDPAARVVIAFSPPAPIPGFAEETAYASLVAPAFVQTGTNDILPGQQTYEGHLAAYRAAPADGARAALVHDGVDHYFGGAIGRAFDDRTPQLEALAQAANLSVLFIAAFGEGDGDALAALDAASGRQADYRLERK